VSWAKVDDGWWCHPKVMGLPLAARGLWVSALSWSCAQRRPVVPPSFLAMIGATTEDADALLDAGLWIDRADGWEIHDWSEYQEMSLREKRAEAGRKGGLTRGNASKSEANVKQDASKSEAKPQAGALPVPSLPVPTPPPVVGDHQHAPTDPDRPVDEQTRLRAVALVAKVEAGDRASDGAWCGGIRREILTGPDPDRLRRIDAELAAGRSPEDIAAAWSSPDPLTGLLGVPRHTDATARPVPPEYVPLGPPPATDHRAGIAAARAAREATTP
jgi:hypothetical protein